jgi:hypothetical protein
MKEAQLLDTARYVLSWYWPPLAAAEEEVRRAEYPHRYSHRGWG